MAQILAGLGGLFFVFLFTGAVFGLVAILVVISNRNAKKTIATFAASATELGLTLTGSKSAARLCDGVRGQIDLASESRGSGKSRRTVSVTRYSARPAAPLRMNLQISPQLAFFGDVADALGISSDIVIGDAPFDAAFRVAASEPELAQRVLTGDAARHLLHATGAGRVRVDDQVVRMQHDGWDLQPGVIARNLELVEAATRSLGDARAREVASWEHACRKSWTSVANAEGFSFDPGATTIHGSRDGAHIWVRVDTEKGKFVTQVIARFASPLDIGLSVYPTRVAQSIGKLFGAQDVRVGHTAFDEAFTVKAADDSAARAVLTAEVADALTTLLSCSQDVRVDNAGLTATLAEIQTDPRALSTLIRDAITVATLRRAPASAGAFR